MNVKYTGVVQGVFIQHGMCFSAILPPSTPLGQNIALLQHGGKGSEGICHPAPQKAMPGVILSYRWPSLDFEFTNQICE
jgi:hypothetical protein